MRVVLVIVCSLFGLIGCANDPAFNNMMIQMGTQLNCQAYGGVYNPADGSCQQPPKPVRCSTTGTVDSGGVYTGSTVCQ